MARSILLVCVQLNEGTSKRTGAILKLEIRHCRRSRLSFSLSFSFFLFLPLARYRPCSLSLSLSLSLSVPSSVFLPPFIEHRGETHSDDGNISSEGRGGRGAARERDREQEKEGGAEGDRREKEVTARWPERVTERNFGGGEIREGTLLLGQKGVTIRGCATSAKATGRSMKRVRTSGRRIDRR